MGNTRAIVAAIWMGFGVIGCGSSNSPSPTIVSFTATPDNVQALGGGVTLSWNVQKVESVSIDNGIGMVPTQGTTAVHVAASTTFTLTATNATGTATATAVVTVVQPTGDGVSGKVTDANSNPEPGLTVHVTDAAGANLSAMTDADGNFSIPSVAKPYTATVVQQNSAYVFQSLTRATPMLFLFPTEVRPSNRSGQLNVIVSDGGHYPQATNYDSIVGFASPRAKIGVSFTGPETGLFPLTVSWVDSVPIPAIGAAYVLQAVLDDTGLPTDYTGYGSASARVQDGETTGLSLALGPVASEHLTATVSLPTGFGLDQVAAYLDAAPDLHLYLFSQQEPASTSVSLLMPAIPGTSFTLSIIGGGPTGQCVAFSSGLAANASGVAIECPAPPLPETPPNGQEDVNTTTVFSWSPLPQSVYQVGFQPNIGETGPKFFVWSAVPSTTIPDLSSIGLGLPPNTNYGWQVVSLGPYADMDALTAPPLLAVEQLSTYQTFGEILGFSTPNAP